MTFSREDQRNNRQSLDDALATVSIRPAVPVKELLHRLTHQHDDREHAQHGPKRHEDGLDTGHHEHVRVAPPAVDEAAGDDNADCENLTENTENAAKSCKGPADERWRLLLGLRTK